MSIEFLIYTSKASPDFKQDEDLENIIAAAITTNKRFGITGALYYKDHCFMQYIEGSTEALNGLYNILLKDRRHYQIQLRNYGSISHRKFADWSMGRVSQDIIKIITSAPFEPILFDDITPAQSLSFFQEISNYVAASTK